MRCCNMRPSGSSCTDEVDQNLRMARSCVPGDLPGPLVALHRLGPVARERQAALRPLRQNEEAELKTTATPPVTIVDIIPESAAKVAKILSGYVNGDGELIVRGVQFPRMNKNNTLATYRRELEKGYNDVTVIVMRYVLLDSKMWSDLTNNLMDSERFLYLKDGEASDKSGRWTGIGGSWLSPSTLKELGWPSDIDDTEIVNDPEKLELFRKHNKTIAVTVGNGTETIFIDCEGYNYARYVGF